jgi:hypothetical protein
VKDRRQEEEKEMEYTAFRKQDFFPSSGEGATPILFGPLERTLRDTTE